MPEMARIIDPVIIPVDRKRIGIVSMAPPTMELNIASIVVDDGFTLSDYESLMLKCIYDKIDGLIIAPYKRK
jgi:hypothetical protein